jgi:hypothetical protein
MDNSVLFSFFDSFFTMTIAGIWHFRLVPFIFAPLYAFMIYGSLSVCVAYHYEGHLAGVEQLQRLTIGQVLLSLVLPLLPFVNVCIFIISCWFTLAAMFMCKGPFAFFNWQPFVDKK